MSQPAVHWHEGMFLRPHHLQAADRYAADQAARLGQALVPYAWGCRALDVDPDALANNRFAVRRLAARMPDGTLVSLPEDGALAPLDLKPPLDRQQSVTVLLALPVLRPGRTNVADAGSDPLVRYRLDAVDADDENAGGEVEPLVVRRPNLQLLTSDRDASGYVVLPLAKVERSDRADGRPRLAPGYILPALACDACPLLSVEILQAVYDRIGRKIDVLAGQVRDRGMAGDSLNGDAVSVGQLRLLNESYALLHGLAFTPGIHPLPAYLELCRIVGMLAVIGPTRRTPPLPRYDHDDLGNTFFPLKRAIDDLLDRVVEPEFKDRPFMGAGLRMQVDLEPAWVEANWQLYIGAQSTLPADELVRVLTQPGVLDMKVGSSERVDSIFRFGRAGLRFLSVRTPPRVLPAPTGMAYFQLAAEQAGGEWPEVQKSLSLAVRLNENRVVGNIQGQRDLTVQVGPQTTTLRFTLFAVPVRSLGPGELVAARPEGGQ